MATDIGTSELIDVWASGGLIVEPSLPKKVNGWDVGEQPPAEYENWMQNNVQKKLNHILQNGIPEWNAITTYRAGVDIVKLNGVIYIAVNTNTNNSPPSGNWKTFDQAQIKQSLERDADLSIHLVGDVDSPGSSKYYGTNSSGERGFHSVVVAGFETGDMKVKYGSGTISGYVRGNGLTIGNAASGATERANDDTEALFTYLYNSDTTLTVSGGRGASAAADYAANKRLTLPDFRNRSWFFLDGMGNSNTSRITSAGSGVDGTVLGASGGQQSSTLAQTNLPPIQFKTGYIQYGFPSPAGSFPINSVRDGGVGSEASINSTGFNSTPFSNLPPAIVAGTVYFKL